MTAPRINTIADSKGWRLQVIHEGTAFTFRAGKRKGAEDCRRTEVHLERVARKYGWTEALKAEVLKVDLLDPANAPPSQVGEQQELPT